MSYISKNGEYLTFEADHGTYGVDILRVQEIRGYAEPTRMARSDPRLLGVINLRGAIVPIVDLRKALGLDTPAFGPQTVVIVVSVNGMVFGAVVDAVNDVVSIPESELKPPPNMAADGARQHVGAIATVNDRLLQVLNICELFNEVAA